MKNLCVFLVTCVLGLSLTGCNKIQSLAMGEVPTVKAGILDFDKSLTIGQAFDSYQYFKSTKWEDLKTDNGRKGCLVKCEIDTNMHPTINVSRNPDLKSVEMQYQFFVNQDKSIQVNWCGIAVEKTDGSRIEPEKNVNLVSCMTSLKSIYNNQPVS